MILQPLADILNMPIPDRLFSIERFPKCFNEIVK